MEKSVVVMDNCSIHHDDNIREVIEVECGTYKCNFGHHFIYFCTGTRLIYLPPYSPDLNPIKKAFSFMKAWLQRHEKEAVNPQVRPWLVHRALRAVTIEDAEGWFGNCGYL
jgi:transposase